MNLIFEIVLLGISSALMAWLIGMAWIYSIARENGSCAVFYLTMAFLPAVFFFASSFNVACSEK